MEYEIKYKIKKGHFTDVGMTLEELIDFGILEPVQTHKVYRWKGNSIPVEMDFKVFIVEDKKPRLNQWLLEKCLKAGLIIESEEVVESEAGNE